MLHVVNGNLGTVSISLKHKLEYGHIHDTTFSVLKPLIIKKAFLQSCILTAVTYNNLHVHTLDWPYLKEVQP